MQRWRRIRKFLREVVDSPTFWMGLMLGGAVGATIRLPLFEYTLPPDIAAVWGAAAGAGITVAGAWWVSRNESRGRKRDLYRAVMRLSLRVFAAAGRLQRSLSPSDDAKAIPTSRRAAARALARTAHSFHGELEAFEPTFVQIGVGGRLHLIQLQSLALALKEAGDFFASRPNGFDMDELPPGVHEVETIVRELQRMVTSIRYVS